MSDPQVLRTLAAEIGRDLSLLGGLCEDSREVLDRFAASAPGRLELRIPASLVHDYYTGMETALSRIVEVINGAYPTGAESHVRLLELMTLDVEGLRPAVLSEGSRKDLDELRKFRHFFRHAYAAHLQWEHIRPLLERVVARHAGFASELEAFRAHLFRLAGDLERGEG